MRRSGGRNYLERGRNCFGRGEAVFLYPQTVLSGLKRLKNGVIRIIFRYGEERREGGGLLFQSFIRFVCISTPTLQNQKISTKWIFQFQFQFQKKQIFSYYYSIHTFPITPSSLDPYIPLPTHSSFPNQPSRAFPPPPLFHLREIAPFLSLSIPTPSHHAAFSPLPITPVGS